MLVFCLLLWVWVLPGVTNSTTGDRGRPKLAGIGWVSGVRHMAGHECRSAGSPGHRTEPRYRHHPPPTHTQGLTALRGSQAAVAKCGVGAKGAMRGHWPLFMREPGGEVSG